MVYGIVSLRRIIDLLKKVILVQLLPSISELFRLVYKFEYLKTIWLLKF